MATVPVIANYLTIIFNWRANFVFIFILVLLSIIAMQVVFKEPKKYKHAGGAVKLKNMIQSYFYLLRDKKFIIF